MDNEKLVQILVYLCAFTFMRVKIRAPYVVCKNVAQGVLENARR